MEQAEKTKVVTVRLDEDYQKMLQKLEEYYASFSPISKVNRADVMRKALKELYEMELGEND